MKIRELAERDLPLGYFDVDELQISAYKKGYSKGYKDGACDLIKKCKSKNSQCK